MQPRAGLNPASADRVERVDEPMKAERRHELKENDLIHFLTTTMEAAKQRSQTIGVIVVAIAAVAVVGTWTISSRSRAKVDDWSSKAALTYPNPQDGLLGLESLVSLRRGSSDETFVLDCLVDQGAIALDLAGRASPAPDPKLNAMAKDAFDELLSRFGEQFIAAGVGHSGLATVAENDFAIDQNPAHKETARRHLKNITENAAMFSGTPFMDNALARLNDLDHVFTPVIFAPPAPPIAEEDADATGQNAAVDDAAVDDDASSDASSDESNPADGVDDPATVSDPPGAPGANNLP